MKTFPGWREVGCAMWRARRQDGVTIKRTFTRNTWAGSRPHSSAEHRWRHSDGREVMVSHNSMLESVDVSIGDGGNDWETTYNNDAEQVLRVLAALDLIPAELAEVVAS